MYERAAEVAPAHPDTLVLPRLQDFNLNAVYHDSTENAGVKRNHRIPWSLCEIPSGWRSHLLQRQLQIADDVAPIFQADG
jgi:hypothetical protein